LPAELIERLIALPHKLLESDWPTVGMSAITLLVLLCVRVIRPSWPAPLMAMVVATYISWQFELNQYGIQIVGNMGTGLPIV
ncbi:sodium-independent anion transporter, partial [Xenorhabdus bovienii]|uniref:SulP family inorganic anion transporter n=2 Tax=Xenorhabdus TaxID=626 RepID=UPI0023B23E6A